MQGPVVRKLKGYVDLSVGDVALIEGATAYKSSVTSGTDLVREGEAPNGVLVVCEGILARYKQLPDGERQIVAFLLPGDFCDVNASLFKEMDHGITEIGPCLVVTVPRSTFQGWMSTSDAIKQAVEWATLVDEAILREWLVNIGARNAPERTAHLFCELRERLRSVQHIDNSFPLPLAQVELGHALGLSVVHVNRTLGKLRTNGLATSKYGQVTSPDFKRLASYAGFKPNYLHCKRHTH